MTKFEIKSYWKRFLPEAYIIKGIRKWLDLGYLEIIVKLGGVSIRIIPFSHFIFIFF